MRVDDDEIYEMAGHADIVWPKTPAAVVRLTCAMTRPP